MLWVCRVSVASLLIGLLILLLAPQSQDLFREVTPDAGSVWEIFGPFRGPLYWFAFQLLAFICWAMPVHYAARMLLQHDVGLFDRAEAQTLYPPIFRWVPRILGIGCFVALLLGEAFAWAGIPSCESSNAICQEQVDIEEMHLVFLILSTTVALAVFWIFVVKRRAFVAGVKDWRQGPAGFWAAMRMAYATSLPPPVLPFYLPGAVRNRGRTAPQPPDGLAGAKKARLIGATILLIVSVLPSVFLLIEPAWTAQWFARAFLFVVVLGAWVPLLSLLAFTSHYLRFPVILSVYVVLGIFGYFNDDHYDMRVVEHRTASDPRPNFEEALEMWRKHGGDDAPIIVATAGGASRAAYHTGLVLGYLHENYPAFRDRLFAISGVSGGSLGAAVYASLADRPDPPCQHLEGAPMSLGECLNAVLLGDFLSPLTIAFAFHDITQLPLADRAQVLERSWERRYATFARPAVGDDGLARDFTAFLPGKNRWRPLLLLNGTSVESGKRLIASHLRFAESDEPLFVDTYDALSVLNSGQSAKDAPPWHSFRLSTAVTVSARFPLITPAGNLRDRGGQIADRVVDGGYFENFGALTAADLARRLYRRTDVMPFVIQISSDPDLELAERPRMPDADDQQWATTVRSIFDAFFATRTARGSLATAALRNQLCNDTLQHQTDAPCPHYAHIRLQGIGREVSMSWWLSTPVHHWIEGQLCQPYNAAALATVAKALGRGEPVQPPGCP